MVVGHILVGPFPPRYGFPILVGNPELFEGPTSLLVLRVGKNAPIRGVFVQKLQERRSNSNFRFRVGLGLRDSVRIRSTDLLHLAVNFVQAFLDELPWVKVSRVSSAGSA